MLAWFIISWHCSHLKSKKAPIWICNLALQGYSLWIWKHISELDAFVNWREPSPSTFHFLTLRMAAPFIYVGLCPQATDMTLKLREALWSKSHLIQNLLYKHIHEALIFTPIYLWRNVVCSVLYLWDPPNRDASDCILDFFGKLSMMMGAWAWFHDGWTCDAKSSWRLNHSFTEN
jgi:hypothetical protein